MLRQFHGWLIALLGAALVSAACGTDSGGRPAAPTGSEAATGATVRNCGRELTVPAPPQRVVSTSQHGTEMLIALGLGERVVGTGFTYAEPLPEQAVAFRAIPQLSKEAPTRELVLAAKPDLVVAGFFAEDTDSGAGFASVEELKQAGAEVFGLSAGCADDPATVTMETTHADIAALGQIFDVEDRAAALVADMRRKVDKVTAAVAGRPRPRALVYSNGEGPLGVVGAGLGSDLLRLAGAENVFAGSGRSFARLSVEEVAVSRPEVFLTVDYSPGPTPQEKAETLYRVLPQAPATEQRRAFPVPDAGLNESIRNADTIELIARALFPDAF